MGLSLKERDRRYAAIRKLMKKNGLDSLVVSSRDSHMTRGNTRYITNRGVPVGEELVVFPVEGDPCIVGFLASEAIRRAGWVDKFTGGANVPERIEQLKKQLSILDRGGKIGIVGMACIPFPACSAVQAQFPGRVVDADWIFKEVRSVKSPEEIEKIRISASITDKVYTVIRDMLRPGFSDYKIFGEARKVIHEMGCEYSMEFSGIHAGLVGLPWGDVMEANDRLRFEFTPAYDGYYTQILADLRMGKFPPQVQKLIPVWEEALKAGASALRPGAKVSDVENAISTVIRERGYTPMAGRLGHGIGLDVIDYYLIHPSDTSELKSGMTFAVHPGVTAGAEDDINNFHGGYTYLVTDKGGENLSKVSIVNL